MTGPATNLKSVCGLIGSLRKGSYNRGLMRAAAELGRDIGLDIRIFDRLGEIPHYNADMDRDGLRGEPVESLKTAIGSASALLIATPEYNYSIPGVLKNAIDWASRPAASSPLSRKAAAIMGASIGISGTMRAQYHLRQCFVFTNTLALLQPEVIIPKCADRFDADANLTDQSTRDLIRKQLDKLVVWIRAAEDAERMGALAPG